MFRIDVIVIVERSHMLPSFYEMCTNFLSRHSPLKFCIWSPLAAKSMTWSPDAHLACGECTDLINTKLWQHIKEEDPEEWGYESASRSETFFHRLEHRCLMTKELNTHKHEKDKNYNSSL